jgi:hypothetical protein
MRGGDMNKGKAMMMKNTITKLTAGFLVLVFSILCAGCGGGGRVEGKVVDKEGATISGTITLERMVNSKTASTTTTKLDAKNNFVFANVPPGDYFLKLALEKKPCYTGGGLNPNIEGWIGVSLDDGGSQLMRWSKEFTIATGKTVTQTFTLPICYH